MDIYVPDYYKDFECIKGECKHSCCIGWEIDIDEKTLEIYENTPGDFGKRLNENISYEGNPHFVMDKNNRCPFLNSSNLCDIYVNLGGNRLCQICSDHPRYRNYFDTREEMGLGMCCEAAAKLILSKKEKVKMMPENNSEEDEGVLRLRKNILSIIQDRSINVKKRIEKLLKEYELSFPQITFDEWIQIFLELEILNEQWKSILEKESKNSDYNWIDDESYQLMLEQLTVYFVLRYINKENEENINGWLSFCVLSVYMVLMLFSKSKEKTKEYFILLCVLYSSEIEYSPDNLSELMFELI